LRAYPKGFESQKEESLYRDPSLRSGWLSTMSKAISIDRMVGAKVKQVRLD